ncbi:hypothetical protein MRX96_021663 [Rhipicephalus microplus]
MRVPLRKSATAEREREKKGRERKGTTTEEVAVFTSPCCLPKNVNNSLLKYEALQEHTGSRVDEMVVTWKSWYTLYSVAFLSFFGWLLFDFVANSVNPTSTETRNFTKALYLVVPLAASSKVAVNVCSAIFGCGNVNCYFRFFILAACIAGVVATAHITTSPTVFGDNHFRDLLKVTTIVANFVFFFYDMLHSITLRPCCEVLIAYVRHQQATLRAVLPTHNRAVVSPLGLTGVAELQRVKANVHSIGKLRQLLNDIWQYSLVVSSVTVLVVGCVTVYCTFDSGMPWDIMFLGFTYITYSSLDLIDMALLSHAMSDEVLALKDTLETASLYRCTAAELRQGLNKKCIFILRRCPILFVSLRPEEWSFSGAKFFSLDFPLLVSIGGSIITYSVILVQTSKRVEHQVLQKSYSNLTVM